MTHSLSSAKRCSLDLIFITLCFSFLRQVRAAIGEMFPDEKIHKVIEPPPAAG
jgi:hypothetical protein